MRQRHTAKLRAGALALMLWVSLSASAATLDDLQVQIDAGHYDAAARSASAYLKLHPGNRDARFLRARALAGQGETDAAIEAFKRLAADYPLRPEPANDLAVLYADRGDYANARRWLEKALATQPAYATAHRNLGDVYTALADLAYRKALGAKDVAAKTPLTMLDRFYYAGQTPAADGETTPPPKPPARPDAEKKTAHSAQDGAAPSADRSIIQTVRAWARAWSNQDFSAYRDFYADDFDPGDDLSRAQWLAVRKARLTRPQDIHIAIKQLSVQHMAGERARVTFVQHYASKRYTDTVNKQLLLKRVAAGWRIVDERDVSQS